MSSAVRPRRSILYMSGANARTLEKAKSLPVDGLIFDLEDAVLPGSKAIAREQILGALTGGGYGKRELLIRVNAMSSPWGKEDVELVSQVKIDGVLIPKIESAAMLEEVLQALDVAGVDSQLPVWVMIETPRGVLRVEEIISASPRISCVVVGTSDLTKDLHARHVPSRQPLLNALAHCVLVARAYEVDILDGVHLSFKDYSGLRAACEQGRDMGFDGKTLIHPNQIDTVNAVFSPSKEDVEDARQMIAAWKQAESQGQGVCIFNGRLIEKLHVEAACRLVNLADAIANLEH